MTKHEAYISARSFYLHRAIIGQTQPVSYELRHILWKRASMMAAEYVIANAAEIAKPLSIPVW
ncbi:hypothetical protein UFOVP1339_40 [uncultured Caudovirales phage]|uniref:Uncharacterized protein n=1 Tax=uncultured Caudovirales phage TaxID=2100421 RepID=A0A6J5RSJ5_9CAUD|nr:hypothetical protein UFOVP1339_40 [uncultured Caudovirales phage]